MTYTLKEKIARMEKHIAASKRASHNNRYFHDLFKYGGPTPADNPYAGSSTGSSSGSSMGDSIGQLDLSEKEVANIKIAKKESDKER